MPRRVDKVKDEKANENWSGYIRCEFDVFARDQFKVWRDTQNEGDVLVSLMELCETELLRFSVVPDPKKGSWAISITGLRDASKTFAGWTLTAWAGTWENGLLALWYKHTVLLEGDWSKGISAEGKRSGDYVG